MALGKKAKTVLFIGLGVAALGIVTALLLSSLTGMDKGTIAMTVLALCSAIADTLAIVLYLRGSDKKD